MRNTYIDTYASKVQGVANRRMILAFAREAMFNMQRLTECG